MQEMTTVQMVQWLSSVSANQCQMRALIRIPPGANFFPSFFSLPVMLGRQSTHTNNIPCMGDAPYVGSRLGDDYIYEPQVTLKYTDLRCHVVH